MLLLVPLTASAAIITVDDGGFGDYTSIQDAINYASSGDTILVESGTYVENIDVNIENLTITSNGNVNIQAADIEKNVILIRSNGATIDGLDISNSDTCGICIDNSDNHVIINNTISENGWDGIHLQYSSNCAIDNNNLSENGVGIQLQQTSDSNIITNNVITTTDAGADSIIIVNCSNNNIYNNYFEGRTVCEQTNNNIWNTTKTPGTNIIGGPYLGGNYWALPEGGGFSQTHADTDNDGISDTTYILSLTEADQLPLSTLTEDYDLLIAGSTTVYQAASLVTHAYEADNSQYNLNISGIGSTLGINSVGLGNVDIGMAGRSLTEEDIEMYPTLITHKVGGIAYVLIANKNSTAPFNIHRSDVLQAYENNIIPQNLTNNGISLLLQREGVPAAEHFVHKQWLHISELNYTIQEVGSNEDMLHTIETTEGALGFVPFRLANTSDKVSILGIIDDGDDGSGDAYDFADINAENIKLEIKDKLEMEIQNVSGNHYVDGLTCQFMMLTKGEPDSLEADYISYVQSAGSVQYFQQAYAYSLYEIEPPATTLEITVSSPVLGQAYNSSYVTLEVSANEMCDIWYKLDGGADSSKMLNVTSLETLVGPVYVEGEHSINVYAEDISGVIVQSAVTFTIDLPEKPEMAEYLGFYDASSREGDIVTIPLEIGNVSNGPIQTMKIILDYNDSVLKFNSVNRTQITDEWSFIVGADNRSLTLTTTNQSAAIPSGYSGELWNLNFRVIGTSGETSEITPVYIDFSNTANEHGTATAKSGLFSVETTGTLSGNVEYSYNGTGIGNVNVYLMNESGTLVDSTSTDSTGDYIFAEVEPGTYTVAFMKTGFYSEEANVEIFTGTDSYANVSLIIKGDADNNGNPADAVDVNMIMQASVGDYPISEDFDLDGNGDYADAVDINMMIQASVGDIVLE